MEKPVLSPDFTMEDLYKLREFNSLRHVGMTADEVIADINKGAREALEIMARLKREKELVTRV
jgi:uncharacterized protein YebE (UPF0316 family)